jgi:hypothetical protein
MKERKATRRLSTICPQPSPSPFGVAKTQRCALAASDTAHSENLRTEIIRPQAPIKIVSKVPPIPIVVRRQCRQRTLVRVLLLVSICFSLTHPSNPRGSRSGVRLVDCRINLSLSRGIFSSKTSLRPKLPVAPCSIQRR